MFKFWRKYNTYYMAKKKLTLSIDEEVLKRAKSTGLNLSQLFENVLKNHYSPSEPITGVRIPMGPLFSLIQHIQRILAR